MKLFFSRRKIAAFRAPMILWISLALFAIIAGIAWLFFKRLQGSVALP